MTRSTFPAAAVAIASYVIVAGIFTQGGVALQPAAAYFHTSLPDTAALFSYAGAGNLGGILVSIFVFTRFSIRQVMTTAYLVFAAGLALMIATRLLPIACDAIFLMGLAVGTGLSAGAVIIAKLFEDRARAIAFLSTDCAFSAMGFVMPVLAGAAFNAGWPWWSGYAMVGVAVLATIVAVAVIPFPAVGRAAAIHRNAGMPARRGAYLTIALIAIGLATYVCGQTTFVIWAPAVLQNLLGVPALEAGTVVSSFFGPSSLGLITAAILVSRIPPRVVLLFALSMGVALSLLLATLTDAHLFFIVTFAFGFTTTCMFKLMISVGSEQLPSSPPTLVTFLLLCSGIGTMAAPIVSAQLVKLSGLHASLWDAFGLYVATLLVTAAALVSERVSLTRTARAALA